MLARSLTPFFVTLVAAASACSSTTEIATSGTTSAGSGGAGTSTSGSGGSGAGGFQVTTTSSGAGGISCTFFPEAGDAGASAPIQALCDPNVPNAADCPAQKPTIGDSCAPHGLQCAYDRDQTGYVVTVCEGQWGGSLHTCHRTCSPTTTPVPVLGAPACGSLPDIPCLTTPNGTDQERADATLHQIADCCGLHTETSIIVLLQDGCATASAGKPEDTACLNSLLAGRRWQCATALACVETEWSTLP
jgi:hypothetical protein